MSTPNREYIAYKQKPFYFAYGLGLSNNATTPNTSLDVAAGGCMDSTATKQIILDSSLTIDATTTGVNALDTGSLAANKLYAVYVIADGFTAQAPAAIMSLDATNPLMPFAYDFYRLIGYVATDSSAHFLKGYWTAGDDQTRQFFYDAPQATSITAGAATSYTTVALTNLVPAVDNVVVSVAYDMTPSAAGRALYLQPYGATGDAFIANGQVSTVHVNGNAEVLAKLNSAAPSIAYKWTAGGGDAVALDVAGYKWSI